jgi:hypothetical protein
MVNHGISTGGLFLLVGMLYERRHTKALDAFAERNAADPSAPRSLDEGEIVLINGRYDESRGDPQIIADSISLDFTAALAVDAPSQPHDDFAPAWAAEADEPPDAFMTALEDGPPAMLDDPLPEPPPPDAFDPAKTPEHHLRNGDRPHEPGAEAEDEPEWVNGDGHLPPPGEQPREDRAPRIISVLLVTSDDGEKDRRKLQHIHNTLVSYPGVDRFRIVVVRGDDKKPISFPKQTTNICAALEKALADIVGSPDLIEIAIVPD